MLYKLLLTTITLFIFSNSNAQFDNAWNAMDKNDYDKARQELEEASKNPENSVDAHAISILLNNLEGKEYYNKSAMESLLSATNNPNPYLFALWYSTGVTGGIGMKSPEKVIYLKRLLADPKTNESLKTALRYALGMHYSYKRNHTKYKAYYNEVGQIKDWQFTGDFDNTSGSGFDKKHDPITHPEKDAVFYSQKNAPINWFVPKEMGFDPWVTFRNILPSSEGVVFAQTFINNPSDRTVRLSLGVQGTFKVWVNDKLVISESEENRTELDYYNSVINLKEGNNRVLIQLCHTNKSIYPYFMLRVLDPETLKPFNDLTVSSTHSAYNSSESVTVIKEIPHFAEAFFEEKIAADSTSIVDYLLLSKCYSRAGKNNKAIEVLEIAKKLDDNNVLINMKILENYIKINDRTALMLQLDYMKELNPDLLFIQLYDFNTAKENEDIDKASELLLNLREKMGETNASYLNYKIGILSTQKNYQEMFEQIEYAYSLYPNESTFLELKYFLEKNRTQSVLKALKVLKKYNKDQFNYRINQLIINEYQSIGEKEKAKKMILQNLSNFPEETEYLNDLLVLEYNQENYFEALKIINKMIGISPFNAGYHESKAYITLALGDSKTAKESFKKAIQYNPNSFDSREKLRLIDDDLNAIIGKDQKDSWTTILQNNDAYSIIEKRLSEDIESEEQYDYVFFEKSVVQFEEGAGVEFTSMGIRILNRSGIDTWKEVSIPTSYYSDRLTITKSEINKKSGQKLEGEKNYNQIVFTNLEVGDIIYLEFRKEIYTGGKLAKEMAIEHTFSNFAPTYNSLYRIYVPKSYAVKFKEHKLEGVRKNEFEFEDFNCTEYRHDTIAKIKEENNMPSLSEVGQTLYISTMNSWGIISDWYADLALPMAREDYNLNSVYDNIFAGKKELTDQEKAELIYSYLCENINYSSVSFRQSNFVPQKPMVTISTKLGDCKDLSTLFHTLAEKAELKTNLVLVNTRDNGENTMQVPSIEFNHCIIRIETDEDTLFQELTDSKLPFGTLPEYLFNAQALVIPNAGENNIGEDLIHIPMTHQTKNEINRTVEINFEDGKMNLKTVLDLKGKPNSDYRWYLSDLSTAETKETIEDYCSDYFEGDIQLLDFEINNLETLSNDFNLEVEMNIENELKSIGTLETFSIPFFETIFTIDQFSAEERNHPFNYWQYEETDIYRTKVLITIDPLYEFEEIPDNVSIKNDFITFEMKVKQISPTQIEVTRLAIPITSTIEKEDYAAFRELAKEISKYEETFVAFKKK